MANSTFNGPIRSEGGFKQISLSNGVATDNFTIDSSGNIDSTGNIASTGNITINRRTNDFGCHACGTGS